MLISLISKNIDFENKILDILINKYKFKHISTKNKIKEIAKIIFDDNEEDIKLDIIEKMLKDNNYLTISIQKKILSCNINDENIVVTQLKDIEFIKKNNGYIIYLDNNKNIDLNEYIIAEEDEMFDEKLTDIIRNISFKI